MKEIDLKEDMFAIEADPRMPVGLCAVIKDGDVLYAGLIDDSPVPTTGVTMILHPEDYESLNASYRKHLN